MASDRHPQPVDECPPDARRQLPCPRLFLGDRFQVVQFLDFTVGTNLVADRQLGHVLGS